MAVTLISVIETESPEEDNKNVPEMSHDDNLNFRTTPTEGFGLLLNADADSVLTRRHVSST